MAGLINSSTLRRIERLGYDRDHISYYSPETWVASISRSDLAFTEYNAAHHHETVHLKQYAFTTFGLASALYRGRQARLAARVFASAHPLVHTPNVRTEPMPSLIQGSFDCSSTESRQYEQVDWILDALNGSPRPVRTLGALLALSNEAPSVALPPEAFERCQRSGVPQLPRSTTALLSMSPSAAAPMLGEQLLLEGSARHALGASDLFEGGAVGAALLEGTFLQGAYHAGSEEAAAALVKRLEGSGRRTLNSARAISFPGGLTLTSYGVDGFALCPGVTGIPYRLTQLLFLRMYASVVSRAGDDSLERGLGDAAVQKALLYAADHQPLEFYLLDPGTSAVAPLDDLLRPRSVERPAVDLPFVWLFLTITDLALATPLPPAFSTELSWYDLHPGWRYLRALAVLEEILSSCPSVEAVHQLAEKYSRNLTELTTLVSKQLGWPTTTEMHGQLVSYVDSEVWLHDVSLGADPALYLCRFLSCLRRVRRPLAWVSPKREFSHGESPSDAIGEPNRFRSAPFVQAVDGLQPGVVFHVPTGRTLRSFDSRRKTLVTTEALNDPSFAWKHDYPAEDVMRNFTLHQTGLRRLASGTRGELLPDILLQGVCDPLSSKYGELRAVAVEIAVDIFRFHVW